VGARENSRILPKTTILFSLPAGATEAEALITVVKQKKFKDLSL